MRSKTTNVWFQTSLRFYIRDSFQLGKMIVFWIIIRLIEFFSLQENNATLNVNPFSFMIEKMILMVNFRNLIVA